MVIAIVCLFVYRWSVLGFKVSLLILSFHTMGSLVLRVDQGLN